MKLALAALVLVVAGVPVADGISARRVATAAPKPLVGQWTRTVTAADVTRAGGTNGVPIGSAWILIVKASGATLVGGNAGQYAGKTIPVGAHRVRLELGDPTRNIYGWTVSGRKLTFNKIADADHDRVAVFRGVWTHR